MPLPQYSLATVVAAVVSLLCVIAAPADGALTDANIVLADQTYSSFTDISPAAPGNVVTVNNAVFDEVLNFRVRQSTITVRNSVFKKYLSFSDASLDWSNTTIVVENCTIDAQKIDTRYPSIMTAKRNTADGGGTSTWTMVNNRFPGIIWMPKVLSNFALVNISFNQDTSSASIAGTSYGMVAFGSLHNVTVHVEGNRMDAAGATTHTLITGDTVSTTFSNMSFTVKDNVATRGRFIVLTTACTLCTWGITGNQYTLRGEGLLGHESPIYLGQFRDSNVSFTSNNITYMTLSTNSRKITYGVDIHSSSTAAEMQNFRFTSTGNNFSLTGKEGFVHGLPKLHGPDVYFNIIGDRVFHAAFGTSIALVGEDGNRERTGLHVTIRGCHGPADEYETSTFRSFELIDRSTSKMYNSSVTIEDNVIDTPSPSVGSIGGVGPGSTVTVRRNKFGELGSLGFALVSSGVSAIVEHNEVGTTSTATPAVNTGYLNFRETISAEDGLVSMKIHCNKVKGQYARFYDPLKELHPTSCAGGGKCDLVHNSSVCPGDPTPLESQGDTIAISGATLPEYQPVIVHDNQVLKLTGGSVATRLMIVPHSPGSTACLTNVTIEVESATVLRALYVDGGLCGGRFIARNALFNDTDETTWGFLGIRNGWDNVQEITIEHSAFKSPALVTSRVMGIVPSLHFSNISANAVLKVLHSSVTGLPLTFPKLSDETTAAFVVSNVTFNSSGSESCMSFPTDFEVAFTDITAECKTFLKPGSILKQRSIKRSSITAISDPRDLFRYSTRGTDVPLLVEDTVFTMAASAVATNGGKSGISANSGAKFVRCTFNVERGHAMQSLVHGYSITIQDSVFNVAELRPEYVISPDTNNPHTFVFENVTVNALDVALNSQVTTPNFALIRGSEKELTLTMRDVTFNLAFSTTAFEQGQVFDLTNFPPTFLQVPVSDAFPVLLRGSDGLKGTFVFDNVVFGNISSIAQEVTHLGSVNMSFTNVSFSEPQQIRNFQPTGERLNTTNYLFSVADEAVLFRAFPPHPPLIDVTNLLRLNFTGCTTMGGKPLRAETIRFALPNLTAVPGALVIDDQCFMTASQTKTATKTKSQTLVVDASSSSSGSSASSASSPVSSSSAKASSSSATPKASSSSSGSHHAQTAQSSSSRAPVRSSGNGASATSSSGSSAPATQPKSSSSTSSASAPPPMPQSSSARSTTSTSSERSTSKPATTSSGSSSTAASHAQSAPMASMSSSAATSSRRSDNTGPVTTSSSGGRSGGPSSSSGSDGDATAPTTPIPDGGGGKGAGSGGLVQGADDDGGLKPGEKAGIAVGVIVFVALAVCCVGVVLFGLWKRRQSEDQQETESGSDDANGPDVFDGVVVGQPVAKGTEPTSDGQKDAHPEREATAVLIDEPSPSEEKPKPAPKAKAKPKPKAKAKKAVKKTPV